MTNAKKIAEALNTEFCRTGVILTVEEMIEIIAPHLLNDEKLAEWILYTSHRWVGEAKSIALPALTAAIKQFRESEE